MPEPPDFDQLALNIVGWLLDRHTIPFDSRSKAQEQIAVAEQLRHVWDARGGADGQCADCRWWLAHAPNVGVFGDCALFECHDKEQVHRASKVIISRTGSGEATIVTHSDFGCVQWERRR